MTPFFNEYPAANIFMDSIQTDPAVNKECMEIYQKLLKNLETRLIPDLDIRPDDEKKQVFIGTKKPIQSYFYMEDFDPFVRLLEKNGVHANEVHFMIGTFYSNVMNVVITRMLPTLAAAKTPPADPHGNIVNLFGGKMPQA